jgi:hypothetical protein
MVQQPARPVLSISSPAWSIPDLTWNPVALSSFLTISAGSGLIRFGEIAIFYFFQGYLSLKGRFVLFFSRLILDYG